MKTNSRLFGEGVEVPQFDEFVLMQRKTLLEDRLHKLRDMHYTKRTADIEANMREIHEAIKWTENINEC